MDRVLTITATVNASGGYANTATISAAEADNTREQQCYGTVPVHKPMLESPKPVNNATPNVGNVFLTASNAGPSGYNRIGWCIASRIYLCKQHDTAGTFNGSTGAWTIGTLTNGSSATLTITATVNASVVMPMRLLSQRRADPTPGTTVLR
jgi:hypothetical protein